VKGRHPERECNTAAARTQASPAGSMVVKHSRTVCYRALCAWREHTHDPSDQQLSEPDGTSASAGSMIPPARDRFAPQHRHLAHVKLRASCAAALCARHRLTCCRTCRPDTSAALARLRYVNPAAVILCASRDVPRVLHAHEHRELSSESVTLPCTPAEHFQSWCMLRQSSRRAQSSRGMLARSEAWPTVSRTVLARAYASPPEA
jgi:hypothetical protein